MNDTPPSEAISLSQKDHDSDQESSAQYTVISSSSQGTILDSPYATRKRKSSYCLSNDSSTNEKEDLSSPTSRSNRVNTKKISGRSVPEGSQGIEDMSETEEDLIEISNKVENQGRRKRSSSECNEIGAKRTRKDSEPSESDSTRKRRTELDKLLDAGSSSFHFETAKQTAERLGPIHIDVNEKRDNRRSSDEEESMSDAEKRRPPGWLTIPSKKKKNPKDSRSNPRKQHLLKKVSPGVSSTAKSAAQAKITQFFPKASNKKIISPKSIPPPPKRNRGKFLFKKVETEETEDESDNDKDHCKVSYVAPHILKTMEVQLAVVNGTEVPVEALRFSFENTPAREGWFQTYTRQDQGDEILYYPEPKSFPLPYEMPISTFYPRKDKGELDSRKGKHLWPQSRSSSKDTSVNPSGSVTPNNTNLGTLKEIDNETSKKKGKPSSFATALAASNRLKEALTSVRKTRGGKSEHSTLASSQFNHLERKSPRCHASTKSLISATFGGLGNDNTMDAADNGDSLSPIMNENTSNRMQIMEEEAEIEETKTNGYSSLKGDAQMLIENVNIDECSNDSWAHSELGTNKTGRPKNVTPIEEDIQGFKEMALVLESYLFDGELAMLDGTANPPPITNSSNISASPPATSTENGSLPGSPLRQVRQRQRSSGSIPTPDKPTKIHKHHHKHRHDKNKHRNQSEQMDHVVASNIDPVLLDCLEDELPSGIVAIEGEIPGSSPIELMNTYEGCDSMIYARSSRRWSKPRPFQEHHGTDKKSEFRAVFGGRGIGYLSPTRIKQDDCDIEDTKHSLNPSINDSTILKRLLTDGLPSMNSVNYTGKKNLFKSENDGLMLPPAPITVDGEGYSSSEDTASVCSSSLTITSQSSDASGPSKRKKKRNLTGFPSPKKKRKKVDTAATALKKPAGKAPRVKLLTAVLTQNAKKAANEKKSVKQRSLGKRKKDAMANKTKKGQSKNSNLKSTRQYNTSDVESIGSEDMSDSEDEASDSDVETPTISRRGRPPTKNQNIKKQSNKPKKLSSPKTEWQKAKELAKENALTTNKGKVKNIRPKKIVVSRKAYAAYKKARLAEAAAAEAVSASKSKRVSPNKNRTSPSSAAKSKQGKNFSDTSASKRRKDTSQLAGVRRSIEDVKEDVDEESVLADAEDEESEDEVDEQTEQTKPPGWLTVPKGKSTASKKISKQRKATTNGRVNYKKPKLRNRNIRNKHNSHIPNKSCRLT